MIRVLVFSRQEILQRPLAATLGPEIQVHVEPERRAALSAVTRRQADVIIVDLDTRFAPLEEQLSFIQEVRGSELPVMVITDDDRRSTALELLEHGVYDHFRKPPSVYEMGVVIRRAHEHATLKRELADTKRKLREANCGELLGTSPPMRAVYDLIRRVANLNSGILIRGESGTGKELVARAIHDLGKNPGAPFVPVSCGAIPETLIESELFGHEKGSFTGAAGARPGLLETAADGTLFLDEIGELSPLTQVKLLRVLQERQFQRIGARSPIPLRARILFATHRDLKAMVVQQQFREDLYFRINVMTLEVPALRQRREDIPMLAHHFLERYAETCRKPVTTIHPTAVNALLAYDWPGNVRELENVIHRAVILADNDSIGLPELPDIFQMPRNLPKGPGMAGASFEDVLREFKRTLVEQALADCNGNKTQAATSLHISRAYLHRLLRETEAESA